LIFFIDTLIVHSKEDRVKVLIFYDGLESNEKNLMVKEKIRFKILIWKLTAEERFIFLVVNREA